MNRSTETWSICTCEMYPRFAYGDITSMGTRAPSPCVSTCGGETWSHHPPLSSQRITIAVELHCGEFWIRVSNPSSQLAAVVMDPDPGCMLWPGFGCT